ncbi:MAG: hypothetical protein KatS3mg014_2502 [Actinomycetota bacterium]|nr:MAG: hypothetical protein KatS3mg014_2502 [Actinomycetota bacterium]
MGSHAPSERPPERRPHAERRGARASDAPSERHARTPRAPPSAPHAVTLTHAEGEGRRSHPPTPLARRASAPPLSAEGGERRGGEGVSALPSERQRTPCRGGPGPQRSLAPNAEGRYERASRLAERRAPSDASGERCAERRSERAPSQSRPCRAPSGGRSPHAEGASWAPWGALVSHARTLGTPTHVVERRGRAPQGARGRPRTHAVGAEGVVGRERRRRAPYPVAPRRPPPCASPPLEGAVGASSASLERSKG